MPKRHLPSPTFSPRPPLRQFLENADLPTVVPQLEPRTLQRLVSVLGLEEAGEIVRLATPAQLVRVLDTDVWRRAASGPSDEFDPARFGLWLQVLVEEGVEVAASTLQGLDRTFVITALAQHIAVSSKKTAAMRGLSDEVERFELGGLLVIARRGEAWDALVPLLAHLQTRHAEFFADVMTGCRDLSYEYLEEESGFDHLVGRREQALDDLAAAREQRLEQQGYVTRPRARAFLDGARRTPLTAAAPPAEWEARGYFRDSASEVLASQEAGAASAGALDAPPPPVLAPLSAEATMLGALLDESDAGGVRGVRGVRGLLPAAPDADLSSVSLVAARLGLLAGSAPDAYERCVSELGYLSNVLLESGVLPDKRGLESDAVEAAVATCDLGLQRWPKRWSTPVSAASLVDAFKVGWTVLHNEVGLRTAKQLARTLRLLPVSVGDTHQDLHVLRRVLERAVASGKPWDARARLDVIAILDTPAWATLLLLIAEFPTVPKGCLQPDVRARRHTTEIEFIASDEHLAWVGRFLDQLLDALSG